MSVILPLSIRNEYVAYFLVHLGNRHLVGRARSWLFGSGQSGLLEPATKATVGNSESEVF